MGTPTEYDIYNVTGGNNRQQEQDNRDTMGRFVFDSSVHRLCLLLLLLGDRVTNSAAQLLLGPLKPHLQ